MLIFETKHLGSKHKRAPLSTKILLLVGYKLKVGNHFYTLFTTQKLVILLVNIATCLLNKIETILQVKNIGKIPHESDFEDKDIVETVNE